MAARDYDSHPVSDSLGLKDAILGLANDLQEIMSWLESLGVATSEYRHVFLMPECTDAAQLAEAYRALTPICLRYGFSLGQRLHIAMWGHTPGT